MRIFVRWFLFGLVLWSAVIALRVAHARTLYPGQWAQVSPAEREWFRTQKSPGGMLCCSEADGTYAEEDLRDGHYWTRFSWHFPVNGVQQEMHTDWVLVPDEVVIRDPNRHGAPVVWWAWESGMMPETARFKIRCYAPGAGL